MPGIPGLDIANQVFGTDFGGDGARDAAINAQTDATNAANATQMAMYNQTRDDLSPYRDAGVNYLGQLNGQMGDLNRSFTMSDFQADPGYAFRMSEGQKAIERSAAAKGGLNSGATMKALTRFGQNTASDEYNNAYNRFNNDRTQKFNKLSSLVNMGQNAANQTSAANTNYANQVSANQTNMGNAVASANIAGSNSMNQLLGQGLTAGALYFSDERLKTNIQKISAEELREMKSELKAYRFNYHDENHGKGEWIGVMAQDLEKSKLGRTLVTEDENGNKQLDARKVMSLFLATLAEGA